MVDPSLDLLRVKQVGETFHIPLDEPVDLSWRFAFESAVRESDWARAANVSFGISGTDERAVTPMLEGFISFELAGIPYGEAQRRVSELVTAAGEVT